MYGGAAIVAIRYLRIFKVARKFRHGEQRANRQPTVMTVIAVVVVPSVHYVCRVPIGSHTYRYSIRVSSCVARCCSCTNRVARLVQTLKQEVSSIPCLLYAAPKKIYEKINRSKVDTERMKAFLRKCPRVLQIDSLRSLFSLGFFRSHEYQIFLPMIDEN